MQEAGGADAPQRAVSQATFLDDSGGQFEDRVWPEAHHMFVGLAPDTGVAIVGCTATLAGQSLGALPTELKINVRPTARASTQGGQAKSLTDLDPSTVVV